MDCLQQPIKITVAILAQGTHWADASQQAYYLYFVILFFH